MAKKDKVLQAVIQLKDEITGPLKNVIGSKYE